MPDQAKPIVSALVVSYNAKDLLLQCLHAFYSSADIPAEAVVVDNDSSDGSAAAASQKKQPDGLGPLMNSIRQGAHRCCIG